MLISYAQNFEDVMLWRALGQVSNGFYIDIGAQDPVIDSVSLAFYEQGWRGVHVEPSPMYAEKLRQARPDETVIQAAIDSTFSLIKFYEFPGTGISTGVTEIAEKHQAAGFRLREIEVSTLTLASLLDRYADREVHWLKIDVEGMEKRVIESWKPSRVRPWILVVESTLPNQPAPVHQAWDPLVLSLGYKFAYFDGLNRFYVSKVHPELKDAFLVGPNYFDDFALSGTSGIYCRVIQERHRSQLSEMRLEFEKQHESSQQESEHLHQVIDAQEQEGAARERDLTQAVMQSRQELEELLRHVAAREKEVSEQLLLVRQGAEKDRAEQARIHAEREQSLATQLQSAREELRRMGQEGAARERDLTRAVMQSRQELEELLRHVAAREKEVSEQLLLVRQGAEKDRAEQTRIHAERAQTEKALNEEIAGLQSEIQALNNARQLQTQQHGFEIATKQDELSRLRQTHADHEAQFKNQNLSNQQTILQLRQQIAEVQKNLAIIRTSLSWRMTSPLRKLTSFLAPRGDPGHLFSTLEQAESTTVIEPTVSESQPTKVQPSSPAPVELNMPQADQSISPSEPLIATTLDELLARRDQSFIHCAYQTLLGRDPDEEGFNYYLGRLRSGIPKIEILGQLRRSEEGKDYAASLPQLDAAIRRYRWAHKAIIGWLVRLFVRVEGNNETERKLRGLEGQLFLLGAEDYRRIDQMDTAIAGVHQLLVRQENNLTKQQNELPRKIEIAIAKLKHHQENQQHRLTSNHEVIHPILARKGTIYYYVDHTILCPVSTGMQRVVRNLGRSLIKIGEDVRFVKWNADIQNFELINQNELTHLSVYNGHSLGVAEFLTYPVPDDEPVAIDVSNLCDPSWLLVPEVTHITYHETPVTLDIIMAARRHGLKVAFIYYDAIPLRLKEYQGDSAARHERYMQQLLLADVVVPISHHSGDELRSFFAFHQSAHGTMPVVHPLGLPGETHLSERIVTASYGSRDRKIILSVGSIEPRKNQLKLIQAFEEFSATPQGQGWELILAGNLRADIAPSVHQAMARNSRLRYVQNPSDAELVNFYRDASFTVFPSVEEGFGLPILESLWHAKPCICANFGAMAEVAEGGGCLTINTHEVSEIRQALARLSQDAGLRKELSRQATARQIICWDEYAQSVSEVLTSVANPLSRCPSIYFLVNDTAVNPHHSGIQRLVRQLARGLISLRVNLIPVKWDSELGRLYPPSPSELAHLAQWNGPDINGWSAWIEPAMMQEPKWLLVPELTHGILGEVKQYAKSLDMRCAAIFFDAIPWKLRDSFSSVFAENHRQYLEVVGQFDKVFPISHFSRNDLVNFLLSSRARSQSVEHRIQAASLPVQSPETERCGTIKANHASTIYILSVISIEPRKNPLNLIDAFAKAVSLTSRPLKLTLVGRSIPSFAELADNVSLKLSEIPGATWERDVDDTRLRQLYEEADFTVFPSLEEGFGLPIAESLWMARPCITHNAGAMKEIAKDGGCLLIDMQDTEALAAAMVDLAENPGRRAALSAEAILRPAKTWEDYAKEIVLNIATDRLTDGKPVGQDLPIENKIYSELQNLESRPNLSVCVTTYNRAGWLEVNLKNLFRQIPHPTQDVEILVVDNTSTDHTPEVVQPYMHRSDFRYRRNEKNVGMLGNLRVTAQEARGKYIWILGDDDLIKPHAVERVLQAIKAHPDLSLIYLNYAYTWATDPQDIGDLDQFLNNCPPIMAAGDDTKALTRDIATNNENLFTAIYCLVFRRDHAMKAYSQNTDGRPFSSMRTSIPTTFYVLNYMMDEPAYWVGDPLLVVNFNVSWNQYATLQILERVPEALDLAERMGAKPAGVDRWRENIMSGFGHYFREMFENDPLGNSTFFSPVRLVMRMKHLTAFERVVPALSEIYDRAHLSGHPAAQMPTASLFAFAFSKPRPGECQREWVPSITLTQVGRPSGTAMRTSGQAGFLLHGPYASMDSGTYVLGLAGRSPVDGLAGARVDIVLNGGSEVLAQCNLEAMGRVKADNWECLLPFTLSSDCDDLEFRIWVTERSVLSVERMAVTC